MRNTHRIEVQRKWQTRESEGRERQTGIKGWQPHGWPHWKTGQGQSLRVRCVSSLCLSFLGGKMWGRVAGRGLGAVNALWSYSIYCRVSDNMGWCSGAVPGTQEAISLITQLGHFWEWREEILPIIYLHQQSRANRNSPRPHIVISQINIGFP